MFCFWWILLSVGGSYQHPKTVPSCLTLGHLSFEVGEGDCEASGKAHWTTRGGVWDGKGNMFCKDEPTENKGLPIDLSAL